MSEGGGYFSYLLRMWQVPSNKVHTWRILLENIQTGEKHGFTSLEELLSYLSQVTSMLSGKSDEGNQNEVQG